MSPKYLLPQELAKSPIEEAVFEIRFKPASHPVVERLPALLREKLGDAYPTEGALSIAGGPPRFRRRRREDRYQPRVQLSGPQCEEWNVPSETKCIALRGTSAAFVRLHATDSLLPHRCRIQVSASTGTHLQITLVRTPATPLRATNAVAAW